MDSSNSTSTSNQNPVVGDAVYDFFVHNGDIIVLVVAWLAWIEMYISHVVTLSASKIVNLEIARGKPMEVTWDQRDERGMVAQARNCGLFKRPIHALYLAHKTSSSNPQAVTARNVIAAQTLDPGLGTCLKSLWTKMVLDGPTLGSWFRWLFALIGLVWTVFGAARVWAKDELLVQETFLIQTFQAYAALNVCRFTWGLSLVGVVIAPRGTAKVVMLWITSGLAKGLDILFITRALLIGVRLLNAPPNESGGVGDSINAPVRILWEPLLAGSCEALVTVYGKGDHGFGPKVLYVLLLDVYPGFISWIEPYLLTYYDYSRPGLFPVLEVFDGGLAPRRQ